MTSTIYPCLTRFWLWVICVDQSGPDWFYAIEHSPLSSPHYCLSSFLEAFVWRSLAVKCRRNLSQRNCYVCAYVVLWVFIIGCLRVSLTSCLWSPISPLQDLVSARGGKLVAHGGQDANLYGKQKRIGICDFFLPGSIACCTLQSMFAVCSVLWHWTMTFLYACWGLIPAGSVRAHSVQLCQQSVRAKWPLWWMVWALLSVSSCTKWQWGSIMPIHNILKLFCGSSTGDLKNSCLSVCCLAFSS